MIITIAILAVAIVGWSAYWCGRADGWAGRREVERLRAPVNRVRGEP